MPTRLLVPGLVLMVSFTLGGASARGMPSTPFSEVAQFGQLVPLPPPRPSAFSVQANTSPRGRLPDQPTGRKHDHAVRDICIGC